MSLIPHQLSLFPLFRCPQAAELLLDELDTLYFYEVDRVDNLVAGYGFRSPARAGALVFDSTHLWQLALHALRQEEPLR